MKNGGKNETNPKIVSNCPFSVCNRGPVRCSTQWDDHESGRSGRRSSRTVLSRRVVVFPGFCGVYHTRRRREENSDASKEWSSYRLPDDPARSPQTSDRTKGTKTGEK